MDDSSNSKSGVKYNKYLQKIRSYLAKSVNPRDIELCEIWIDKLTNCTEDETSRCNRYIYALCYQLAHGSLEQPFLEEPPKGKLLPYLDDVDSEEYNDSSSDLDSLTEDIHFCQGINVKECSGDIITQKETEHYDLSSDIDNKPKIVSFVDEPISKAATITLNSAYPSTYTVQSSESFKDGKNLYTENHHTHEDKQCDDNPRKSYEYRTNNLIMKLREIKRQNNLLNNELLAMKAETSHTKICQTDNIPKYEPNMCNTSDKNENCNFVENENPSFAYFHERVLEMENFRNYMIDSLAHVEEKLHGIEEEKKHEINELMSKRETEILRLKYAIRNELKDGFKENIKQIKEFYENKMQQIESKNIRREQIMIAENEKIVKEKNELLSTKDVTIAKLEAVIEEQRIHLQSVMNKLFEKSDSEYNTDAIRNKAYDLEHRLAKSERSRNKCIQAYESRISQLEREKHYLVCNFQLQLVRQKTQQASELADENLSEVSAALDKLEVKYKDIVANMQAAAIKRRIQDQLTLQSILQATCGLAENQGERFCVQSTCNFNQSERLAYLGPRNQKKNPSASGRTSGQQNVNKSLSDDNEGTRYYIHSEGLGEALENVYVPQKDFGLESECHHNPQ